MKAEPRWLTDAEMRAWLGYRHMRLRLDAQVNRDLAREAGLSEPDYDVLSHLSSIENRRERLSAMAARMLWSKSRLSRHVSRMEQRGLVTRQETPGDGRGASIVLTEAGMKAIMAAAPGHVESVRRHFVDLLTDEQIRVLGDVAETVLGHLADEPPPEPREDC